MRVLTCPPLLKGLEQFWHGQLATEHILTSLDPSGFLAQARIHIEPVRLVNNACFVKFIAYTLRRPARLYRKAYTLRGAIRISSVGVRKIDRRLEILIVIAPAKQAQDACHHKAKQRGYGKKTNHTPSRENTSVPLVPPKPNELDMATLSLAGRFTLATKSRSQPSPGLSRLIVGGAT